MVKSRIDKIVIVDAVDEELKYFDFLNSRRQFYAKISGKLERMI